MEEVERRCVLRVLEAVAGNKTAAARVLGVSATRSIASSNVTAPIEPRQGEGDPADRRDS
jgi:hypothetical protein